MVKTRTWNSANIIIYQLLSVKRKYWESAKRRERIKSFKEKLYEIIEGLLIKNNYFTRI